MASGYFRQRLERRPGFAVFYARNIAAHRAGAGSLSPLGEQSAPGSVGP